MKSLLLVGCCLVVGLSLLLKRRADRRALLDFYKSQPTPSIRDQSFAWLRAVFRSVVDTPDRVAEGYEKYSRSNLPFLMPNIRKGPVLALPPSQLKAVFRNAEHKLSSHAPQSESVSAKYTMRDPAIYPSNYTVDTVRGQITKRYGTVVDDLADELFIAFDDIWGKSETWHEIVLGDTLRAITARAINRITVGLPLCRNETYLKRTTRYAVFVPVHGFLIALLPDWLKPILGPLIAWPGKRDCDAGIESCLPLVRERLLQFQSAKESSEQWSPSNDILQWIIEESSSTGDPEEMQARRIAHRIVMLNFNAVPPIALTLSHALLDLFSGSEASQNVERLHQEINTVIADPQHCSHWDKDSVSKLVLLDSTLRESMRKSHFGILAFPRRVTAPEGIELEGGIKVPPGVQIEIPVYNIHMDDRFYDNPTAFKPFRFADGTGPTRDNTHEQRWAVTIDETFLGFGFGRSGCPGRFFAVHVLKTMLGFILENYEIELMTERPAISSLMELRFQNEGQTIRIRRKAIKA